MTERCVAMGTYERLLKGIYVMDDEVWPEVYGPAERQAVEKYVDTPHGQVTAQALRADLGLLSEVEVIMSSWSGPVLDKELLAAAPHLRAVFHAAGSVRRMCPDEFWDSGVIIASAKDEIAVRVADFASSIIYLSLKHVWRCALESRRQRAWVLPSDAPGTRGSTIGMVSLGAVGRALLERLASAEVKLLAFDPYADRELAARSEVELVSLERLFSESDVVTLHAPALPETAGMVTAELLRSMKPGATLVNTARGSLIDEPALIEVLGERPDLFAFLDVTDPEPPASDSALFDLPNVLMTPHIAGNDRWERRALGSCMAGEVGRFAEGRPLRYVLDRAAFSISA
jgi:phosphoglycerate dehydrogenase-like enzyme